MILIKLSLLFNFLIKYADFDSKFEVSDLLIVNNCFNYLGMYKSKGSVVCTKHSYHLYTYRMFRG